MKKLIFVNCLLAIAVVFTYCAKPELNEELSSVNTDEVVSNRVPCTLSSIGPVFNVSTITVCGTNTNFISCKSCLVPKGLGTESFIGPFNLALNAPIQFTITSSLATSLNLSTNGVAGPATNYVFGAGQCRRFNLDANCVLTEI